MRFYLTKEEQIEAGDWILSKGGDWHIAIKVLEPAGGAYTQSTTGGFSLQSFNQKKAKKIIYVFDGYFTNKRAEEDVHMMYTQVKRFNKSDEEIALYKNI